MCLIYINKTGNTVPNDVREHAMQENSDGGGILFLDTLQVIRTMDYKKLSKHLETTRPHIAHFRWATRGKVGKKMCHPYLFRGGWLFSNGTVESLGDANVCDTEVVAKYLAEVPKLYWEPLLSMTNTRFAVVEKDGTIHTHGRWIEHDGILYSKDPFGFRHVYKKPATYTPINYNGGHGAVKTGGYGLTTVAPSTERDFFSDKRSLAEVKQTVEDRGKLYGDYIDDEDEGTLEDYEAYYFDAVEREPEPQKEWPWVEDAFGNIKNVRTGTVILQHNADHIPDSSYFKMVDPSTIKFRNSNMWGLDDDEAISAVADVELEWEECDLLAVYGTLKYGHGNHHLLASSSFVYEGKTVEQLRMVDCGIPYVYPGESERGHHIVVEVYDVKSAFAKMRIDALEGHPDHYTRRKVDIETNTGEIITAWMYFREEAPPKGATFIAEYKDKY